MSTKYGVNAHLALFCNLGDWGSQISDLLLDTSNDEVNLTNGDTARKLFRYYTRLMLIIAELVADIAELATVLEGQTKGNRKSIKDGDELIAFVNNFVKHKKNNSYCHDHHLPIVFADTHNESATTEDVTFGQLSAENSKRFFIPKLKSIVEIALASEKKLIEVLEPDKNFEKIFKVYKGKQKLHQ